MESGKQLNDFPSDRMIGLDKVAELLGVAKRTVYRLIENKDLPKPLKVGRSVKFLVSDVLAYIERLKLQSRGVLV